MKRKGFTIVELAVTLGVSSVIVTSVFAMVVAITSYNQSRTAAAQVSDELTLTKTRVEDWFSANDTSSNDVPEVKWDGIGLAFGDDDEAYISGDTLTLGESEYELDYIDKIAFEQSAENKSMVKCTLSYVLDDNRETYVFMLLKRSVPKE